MLGADLAVLGALGRVGRRFGSAWRAQLGVGFGRAGRVGLGWAFGLALGCVGRGIWAPFLGRILVRGMWCADFEADFGARCVVFGLDFGARCPVFGLDFGARCVVRRFGPISVHGVPFSGCFWCVFFFFGSILVHGVWCADFGADFGARCAFLGSILVRGALMLGSITASGQQDLSRQIGEDLGGIEPETPCTTK